MPGIRILVVENHAELRSSMVEVLQRQDEVSRVDEAVDGLTALALLEETEYDILITELVLPTMSGYRLLEEIRKQHADHAPQVIVTTVLATECFVTRITELGISYYLKKPYEVNLLLSRVRQIAYEIQPFLKPPKTPLDEPSETPSVTTPNPKSPVDIRACEETLRTLLLSVGVSARIHGYHFLRASVRLALGDQRLLHRITKGIYTNIALEYNSTVSRVERAIRHAIDTIWREGHAEDLNKFFGCRVCSPDSRPSNGEFIAMLVDMLSTRPHHLEV